MVLASGDFNGGAAAAPRTFGAENARATRNERRQRKRNPCSARKKAAASSERRRAIGRNRVAARCLQRNIYGGGGAVWALERR
jgi:hypothetical protein